MSFKTLHSFVINLPKEVEETSTRIEDGQTITTTKKVTKDVPHTVILKEPSRKERQELNLFQGIIYNDAIGKGFKPKAVIQQILAKDSNSPISEDDDKNLAAMNSRLQELSNDYMRLNANSGVETEEQKERKQRVLLEYMVLQKKVTDVNTAYQSVYAYTAEHYMQEKTLVWLTLYLTYLKDPANSSDSVPRPMFPGADFAAREDRLGDLEDSKDTLYMKAVEKLPTYWMLYLFGRAGKPEDFALIEEQWAKEVKIREEAEIKAKEEVEKVKAAALAATPPTAVTTEAAPNGDSSIPVLV